MIFSENIKPELKEFDLLMTKTDVFLNKLAPGKESYFQGRNSSLLEQDVYEALVNCAKGTNFENTIHLVSGSMFPDIVANKYYGVEVKSTKDNKWTSVGSSILESTRIKDVERIYMCFGKLGTPIQFKSRPYEECLSGIAVTHYPRYLIDMTLEKGNTIFDKMGIPYDELRVMENPVPTVAKYYRSKLKPGESLWWASESPNPEKEVVSPTVKLFSSLSADEKTFLATCGCVFFPEVVSKSTTKYNRYSLWLATEKGIIDNNVRDDFSAGGQKTLHTKAGVEVLMPAVFGRIEKNKDLIIEILNNTPQEILSYYWNTQIIKSPIKLWCEQIVENYDGDEKILKDILYKIFEIDVSN